MTRHQFEPAAYTQLRTGDRVKIAQTYSGTLTGWWWPILTVDRVDWIRDDHTALMLRLTQPLPCGDRFVLIAGRAMVDAGVRRVTEADDLPPRSPAMLNPMTAWEPGVPVRYTGSLTDLHGVYRAYPCECLRCDDPIVGTARFRLADSTGTVAECVRARSITPVNAASEGDAHTDCTGPHRDSGGEYIDCDGTPL